MRSNVHGFNLIVALLLVAGCGDSSNPERAESATTVGGDALAPAAEATPPAATLLVPLKVFDPDWGTAGVFTAATQCAQCHQARPGEAALRWPSGAVSGEDISPFTEWRHSMMAHSFDDPYFQAVLETESMDEFPALAGLIEDRCLTCHAPMGRVHAIKSNTGLDGDGFYRHAQALLDQHGREGISCTLCHQIAATAQDAQGDAVVGEQSFSGRYAIGDARVIHGPYDGVNQRPMQTQVNYTPRYGHQVTVSSHCASCHTVRTPVMDANTGAPVVPAREFLEQAPYEEWENSVYGRDTDGAESRSCQSCHMPAPENYGTAIAARPPDQVERTPFSRHRFFGGNTYVLELLGNHRAVLGIEASTTAAGFEAKRAATRAFLREETATLALPHVAVAAGQLEVDVEIVNRTGHKLPSAYPSRRVWLHLTASDGDGRVVFESGAPNARGELSIDRAATQAACLATVKPAGFDNGACLEPHRDWITDPAQVAVYEAVLGDTNGTIHHTLLYADRYLKDNRIPPRGFRSSEAVAGTEIVLGAVADADFNTEDAQGGSGVDRVHYRIPLGDARGPYQVTARLLYQSIRPSSIAALHGKGERVTRFRAMAEQRPPLVEELATVTRALN
ncbi:MAG: hypothetical protein ACFCUJ_06065 [Thiotrichales bacterium]